VYDGFGDGVLGGRLHQIRRRTRDKSKTGSHSHFVAEPSANSLFRLPYRPLLAVLACRLDRDARDIAFFAVSTDN